MEIRPVDIIEVSKGYYELWTEVVYSTLFGTKYKLTADIFTKKQIMNSIMNNTKHLKVKSFLIRKLKEGVIS